MVRSMPLKACRRDRHAPETGTPVLVRPQAEPVQQLDDWRRQEQDLPSRAEAIRRLVERELKAKR
jgi:hypothetical protein